MLSPYHCYHLVEKSPWPFTASMGAMLLTSGFVVYFYSGLIWVTLLGLLVVGSTAWQWWRDVSREASFQGLHSGPVQWNMRWGMALFIASEVLFFASFFWAYFHVSLAPPVESGLLWPPLGINAFNPFGIPLLNTTILLSSGLTVTWAHHALLSGRLNEALGSLTLTIVLGFYFTSLQAMEYSVASFTFADSAYGSCFFLATGFHGLHVLIETTFLAVCLTRMALGALSTEHHFGFEAAAWYWHFVDVVWIFLFVSIYWWGG